ncbi:MAG TPA: hypothetical protein VFA33_18140 [Bryobacteraceae bacterium]|nr:hypothetical protein [Bryobacteraceae bacterium]
MDLRTPSGWFFLLIGLILTSLGLFTPQLRAPLLNANVNLYCGLFMVLFGGFLLLLAARSKRGRESR